MGAGGLDFEVSIFWGVSTSQRADSSSNTSSVTANSSTGTGVSSRLPNAHLKNSPALEGGEGWLVLTYHHLHLKTCSKPGISGNRACRGHWEVRVAMPFCLFCLIFFLD